MPDGSTRIFSRTLTADFGVNTVRLTYRPATKAIPNQEWGHSTYTAQKDLAISEFHSSRLIPGKRPLIEVMLTGTEGPLPIRLYGEQYVGDAVIDDPQERSDYAREQYMTKGSVSRSVIAIEVLHS
jgi:hypothetical protein